MNFILFSSIYKRSKLTYSMVTHLIFSGRHPGTCLCNPNGLHILSLDLFDCFSNSFLLFLSFATVFFFNSLCNLYFSLYAFFLWSIPNPSVVRFQNGNYSMTARIALMGAAWPLKRNIFIIPVAIMTCFFLQVL